MTSASPHAEQADLAGEIDRLYLNRWALLLTPLCTPFRAHTHPREVERGKWADVSCNSLGKIPVKKGWNAAAVERWRSGEGREAHIAQMARHLASGGNIGLVVPPGVLVLDADTPEAVCALEAVLDDAPRQDTANGSHYIVRVPVDAKINATVRLELTTGVFVDLRAAGKSQIACEPSIHETGAAYSWRRELPEVGK